MSTPDVPAPDRKTRWGDRPARRQDILAAARTQIAERGYLGLNMRDIAARAGVSPGTLYSYFATKEEIFATLHAEAIAAHNRRITPLCQEATELEPFLVDLITAHLDLHSTYARYFSLWAALAGERTEAKDARADGNGAGAGAPIGQPSPGRRGAPERLPVELTSALRDATIEGGDIVAAALRRMVPGPRRKGEQRRRIAFVWSVMNGIAEQLYSERHHISGVGADELIGFAAHTIAAGLLANAADPPAS